MRHDVYEVTRAALEWTRRRLVARSWVPWLREPLPRKHALDLSAPESHWVHDLGERGRLSWL